MKKRPPTLTTIGIDMATQPGNRGVVSIDWSAERPRLTVHRGNKRSLTGIVNLAQDGTMAIDAPFGWPSAFVKFLNDPARFHADQSGTYNEYAPSLRLRETDRWVKEMVPGVTPLSASTDKLGATAIACSELLHKIHDLTPDAQVIEVYPAASREVMALTKTKLTDHFAREETAELRDHERDAIVAAITARCFDLGRARECPPSEATRTEGSIVLPDAGLTIAELLAS